MLSGVPGWYLLHITTVFGGYRILPQAASPGYKGHDGHVGDLFPQFRIPATHTPHLGWGSPGGFPRWELPSSWGGGEILRDGQDLLMKEKDLWGRGWLTCIIHMWLVIHNWEVNQSCMWITTMPSQLVNTHVPELRFTCMISLSYSRRECLHLKISGSQETTRKELPPMILLGEPWYVSQIPQHSQGFASSKVVNQQRIRSRCRANSGMASHRSVKLAEFPGQILLQ